MAKVNTSLSTKIATGNPSTRNWSKATNTQNPQYSKGSQVNANSQNLTGFLFFQFKDRPGNR